MNKPVVSNGHEKSNSVAVTKKQVQILKQQIDQLAQFVIRVSKYYEGVVPILDKELQVLRGHLGGQANFALAEVSIGKLTGLIMQNADSIKKQNSKTLSVLQKAIKKLQAQDELDESILTETSKFLQSLQTGSRSFYTALPHFEQAISLYQKAFENYTVQNKTPLIIDKPNEKLRISERLHLLLMEELRELISQLAFADKKDKQLSEIKSQLAKGIDHESLMECCLVIIKAIIKDVVIERKHAEKFVTGLHNSLANVTTSVGKSILDAEGQFEKKFEANSELRQQLVGMEDAVDSASDIAMLKEKASDYLKRMASTLESREQADKNEQVVLMELLNEMKDQLGTLEKETSDYKHRLIEQKYHSHHDPLTQVPNRTAYNERVSLEFRRWKRHGNHLCLAVIDVDHFKNINDSFGHAAGDKTLQVIAQNISRCLRSTDFIARWGGEEFVVLLPQTGPEELSKPLESIRSQIEKIPFKFKEKKVTITVSVGASSFAVDDTIEAVFERADRALYQAKNAGRNRCLIK
jgi:diguanylate cyclase